MTKLLHLLFVLITATLGCNGSASKTEAT
ncbi:MAG: hypothetical protein ACI8VT_004441, partial [Saprospiraceae bacterium]